MVQAANILERPAQFQWDEDSYCSNSNCRCTSEAMIAGFYMDTHIAPNSMRNAMGYSGCGGTDAPHGEAGLQSYGIFASWGQITVAQMTLKLNQNIPLDMAVLYGKIPRNSSYIQDMNFYGLHSVVACKRVSSNGELGLYVRDPDRWGDGKIDFVFWPDKIWIPAFAAAQYVCVWPDKPKVVEVHNPVWHVKIAAHAEVLVATLGAKGCISSWSKPQIWGSTASSAPCYAPVKRSWCNNAASTAETVYVTDGVFANKHLKITDDVTVIKL
jgi:hypothetical protein